jgi:hypothetical protein
MHVTVNNFWKTLLERNLLNIYLSIYLVEKIKDVNKQNSPVKTLQTVWEDNLFKQTVY